MMRSTPRQSLAYFFRVSELGSIRAAADHLRIAPSAVSRKIAQLEFEYGVDLFIRQARGVKLTQAGEALFQHLSHVRTLDSDLDQALGDIRGLREGLVRLSMGSGFLREVVTTSLPEFLQSYPRIRIDILTLQADEIVECVLGDVAEIGVVFGAISDPSLNIIVEAERPINLIVASDHPLAGNDQVSLGDVSNLPLGLPPLSSGIRQVIDKAFHGVGLTVEPTLTIPHVETLTQFAATGAGVTFLPAFSCRQEILAGIVKAIPFASGSTLKTKAVVFTRQKRHLSLAAMALLEVIKRTLVLPETSA